MSEKQFDSGIRSMPNTKEYDENYDRIFRKGKQDGKIQTKEEGKRDGGK